MKKHKDISEAQFIKDLKTVCSGISKEDIEWHVNLSRQTMVEKTMNECIRELAIKSGFKQYEGSSLYSPYIEGIELNDELEEFAKLIVKECIDRVSKWNTFHIDENDKIHHSNIADDINEDLRKHFGVVQ